ncbi:MAG: hypothetical protein KAU20_03275 [Nanoarchaeota archaeon]|nr:hypothetical protein [Nanoarchaeota archaeon]
MKEYLPTKDHHKGLEPGAIVMISRYIKWGRTEYKRAVVQEVNKYYWYLKVTGEKDIVKISRKSFTTEGRNTRWLMRYNENTIRAQRVEK